MKSRWTRQAWLRSGLEILVLGAFAGVAGFFFGNLLPTLLGVPATTRLGDGQGPDHPVGLVPREVADVEDLARVREGQRRLHGRQALATDTSSGRAPCWASVPWRCRSWKAASPISHSWSIGSSLIRTKVIGTPRGTVSSLGSKCE